MTKKKKKILARTVIITAAAVVIGFSVTAILWGKKHEPAPLIEILPKPEAVPEVGKQESAYEGDNGVEEVVEETAFAEKKGETAKLLIIIDDVGYNLHQLEPFLNFPGPIVFAVLPGVPYTKKSAELISAAGKTCIIHQPMQAMSEQNLGENPILQDMDAEQVAAAIERSITEVPSAVGMNNHMGSLITSDPEKMEIILTALKEKNLVFIDSVTTSDSAVKKAAQKLQLPYLHRHVFLDNEKNEEYYKNAFESGLQKAEEEGIAVLIGHVWADGLAAVLTEMYEETLADGASFVTLDDLRETVVRYADLGN